MDNNSILAKFNNVWSAAISFTHTFSRLKIFDSLDIQDYLFTGIVSGCGIITGYLGSLMGGEIRCLQGGGIISDKCGGAGIFSVREIFKVDRYLFQY